MSEILLTKIEEVFKISGRGIILAPGFSVSQYRFDREHTVLIKFNSGLAIQYKAKFTVPFLSPPPSEACYYCHLSDMTADISIGCELWLIGVTRNEIER